MKKFSGERRYDQGITSIQKQRDRKREIFERLLTVSQADGKKELKRRLDAFRGKKNGGITMGEYATEWHLGEPLIGMYAPNPMMRSPE